MSSLKKMLLVAGLVVGGFFVMGATEAEAGYGYGHGHYGHSYGYGHGHHHSHYNYYRPIYRSYYVAPSYGYGYGCAF